ncbi:dTMP kinase [Desulfurispora thermophila]|uniref:dTMP kinase n=1 Tax=Desulfurispora thermophila TaxID=265470 RepID=UPI00036BFFE2|nr:dTMP kinase [Desulfurispora thermophila]
MSFFVFEGIDGAGKTTQCRLLAEALQKDGHRVVAVREPGGTALGEQLRQILLAGEGLKIAPTAELFLFLAARAQLLTERILPALSGRQVVLADRFTTSTLAYQGYGRGIPLKALEDAMYLAGGPLTPRRQFLLDIAPQKALERLGPERDRLERLGESFLAAVRQGYLELAARWPKQFVVLDATLPPAELHRRIYAEVGRVLRGEDWN